MSTSIVLASTIGGFLIIAALAVAVLVAYEKLPFPPQKVLKAPILTVNPPAGTVPVPAPTYARVVSSADLVRGLNLAKFYDRGCWRDGGFEHALSDGTFDRTAEYNRAIGTEVIDIPENLTTAQLVEFAVARALDNNYDTIGFQESKIWFGKYGNDINGIVRKYDKFGPVLSCTSITGASFVNRVFSSAEPNVPTYPSGRPIYTFDQFVDRGCWNDVQGNRAVGPTWIDLQAVGLRPDSYQGYALQKAVIGNFDTFAFMGNRYLFLGNKNTTYNYSKHGQATACDGALKVYSVHPPQ